MITSVYDRKQLTKQRDRGAGFTLVELLVVLVILGLIMGLAGPRVLGYLTSSRERAAKLQIEALSSALDLFFLDNGRYPSTSEGLQSLVVRPPRLSAGVAPISSRRACRQIPGGVLTNTVYQVPRARIASHLLALTDRGEEGARGPISAMNECRPACTVFGLIGRRV
jgi:general secretion pathway protein G